MRITKSTGLGKIDKIHEFTLLGHTSNNIIVIASIRKNNKTIGEQSYMLEVTSSGDILKGKKLYFDIGSDTLQTERVKSIDIVWGRKNNEEELKSFFKKETSCSKQINAELHKIIEKLSN